MATLDETLRDIHAMREDLLMFERKYGVPSELFYEAYQRGEEPANSAWVLDWSQWAGTYEIMHERLATYSRMVEQLLQDNTVTDFSELVEHTARHEPIGVSS
jgi:hypothetical protein